MVKETVNKYNVWILEVKYRRKGNVVAFGSEDMESMGTTDMGKKKKKQM